MLDLGPVQRVGASSVEVRRARLGANSERLGAGAPASGVEGRAALVIVVRARARAAGGGEERRDRRRPHRAASRSSCVARRAAHS